MRVLFPLLEEEIEVSQDSLVSDVCASIGLPLNLVCGGKGRCKKCLVNVKENGEMKEVLACQYSVSDGMEIYASREQAASQILETSSNSDLPFDPIVKCYSLNYTDLVTPMCTYDLDVLRKLIPQTLDTPDYSVLKHFSEIYFLEGYEKLHVIVSGNKIIDFIPSNEAEKSVYGIAFDIGTTSGVGYLYDITSGCLLNQHSMLNKQIAFGGDVISRIDYAGEGPESLHKIYEAIMETLAEIITQVCKKASVDTNDVYQTVYCGNSTMAHLFLELNPKHLGLAPFLGFCKDAVSLKGMDTPLPINPKGTVTFMPLLGGFVGADTTAVLLGLPRDKKMRLMIDLGTNGEIAVGNCDKYYVASTACGPALEGAGLTMGMRGTTGAIEKVGCENGKITYSVIGKTAPQGFCGSGIVDAIAMLFREGLIAKRGNFIKGDALDAHPMKNRRAKTLLSRKKTSAPSSSQRLPFTLAAACSPKIMASRAVILKKSSLPAPLETTLMFTMRSLLDYCPKLKVSLYVLSAMVQALAHSYIYCRRKRLISAMLFQRSPPISSWQLIQNLSIPI